MSEHVARFTQNPDGVVAGCRCGWFSGLFDPSTWAALKRYRKEHAR